MSSVDGRLLNGRWSEPFDGTPASAPLHIYAAIGRELNTNAWMFGKNTVRAIFPEKFETDGYAIASDEPAVFVGERRSERMFIMADPEADIYFTSPLLRGDNILVIVGRNATEEYLAHLREKHISYVIVDDATDLRQGLEAVGREFGIRSVSVQGGGILNGAACRWIDRRTELGDLSRYRRAFGCAFHLRVRGRRNRSSGRGTTPSTALRIRKRTWRNMATL